MIAFQSASPAKPKAEKPFYLPIKQRLAEAMREISGSGQTVDDTALALRGFTTDDLSDANVRAARDLAIRQSIRQVA